MKKLSISVALLFLAALLFFALLPAASADGTETLGPPSIQIASGSGIVAAGTGMNLRGDPGTIDVTVPDGVTVEQVLLYWSGRSSQIDSGDDTITVNGSSITGDLIGGPAFFESCNNCDVLPFHSFRTDITALGLVAPGANTLTIDDMDFSRESNGAGVLVIYDDGSGAAQTLVRDGIDLAYIRSEEPGKTTVPQTFTFAAQDSERTAELVIFAASVKPNRPNIIRITVAGQTTELVNELHSTDGPDWDTLTIPVTIPAGATEVTVQLFSEDDGTGRLPASMAWIGATLSVPLDSQFICADFSRLAPGSSVEGLGTVHPLLNITTSGNAVALKEGVAPGSYGAPNGPGSILNYGVGNFDGFSDIDRFHDYVFTFAPDIAVDFFSLKILDFGDYNPMRATQHEATLVAYDSTGAVIATRPLQFTSDNSITPTSGSAGNLQLTGDATAPEGQPGNFTFVVHAADITRVELQFANNSSQPSVASDPNFALALLCYEPENDPDTPETVCADFARLTPGASVEGLGTVHPLLNISTSGNAVALKEGMAPGSYGAPNGPGSILNYGVGSYDGFADVDRVHDYVFTFAPDVTVEFFILKILDFGDFNMVRATEHEATLVAYDSAGAIVDSHPLQFTSDSSVNPTTGSAGNLQLTGDATALEGQPGNFTFVVRAADIARVELQFANNSSQPNRPSDPNMALALLCYEPENDPDTPQTVCADFARLTPGASVEGLGTVNPLLNITTSGDAVAIKEGVTPGAYGAPNGPGSTLNTGVGSLDGFFDIGRVHDYVFTFAPGVTVDFFSLKMLDFGDFNMVLATQHEATLVAYNSAGAVVDSHLLQFTSDSSVNPTSGSAGNLQLTGDATAQEGQPGNFTFTTAGSSVNRVEMHFTNNSSRPNLPSDPNMALAVLCFNVEQP